MIASEKSTAASTDTTATTAESPAASAGIEKLPTQLVHLGDEVVELLNTKIELLKVELKEEARAYARDAALVSAGGLLATIGFTLLHVRQTRGVGAAYMALGSITALTMLNRMRERDPLPQRSVEQVARDAEWIKDQVQSGA